LLVLPAQPRKFTALGMCKAVAAAALVAIGLREPVRSSAAGTQAGMGGVSSTLRTPETQMFRCPRKRGNFKYLVVGCS
jgi:hypothetical protein